ncbi:uncharacterized protein LOC126674383 [Mercurialis annua]|uniref:uncharacterized protein LOC126674383 n=1 Tax=Mercurialis annua TaxID=3986 RepID=UPI00215FAC45|nr:uncharacterized protein LOC126674383 [Mercurialis annua]
MKNIFLLPKVAGNSCCYYVAEFDRLMVFDGVINFFSPVYLKLEEKNQLKRVPISSDCPRCNGGEESILHCLKDCQEVRGLWLISPLSLRVDRFDCQTAEEWIRLMFNSLKTDEMQMFVLCLWTIWNDRNSLVFGNKRLHPTQLFKGIQNMSVADASLMQHGDVRGNQSTATWVPPPDQVLKTNSDAAVSVSRQLSVASAVCRDSTGAVLRCGVSILHGVLSAEIAESYAIRFGIWLAAPLGFSKHIIESDAATVIGRLLKGVDNDVMDNVQLIIEDCLADCNGRDINFKHTPRAGNQVAHSLAKWGVFFGKDCTFDGNIPFPVSELVNHGS